MAPIWGIRPHVGVDAVVPAFLIIVLGGVGSLWGAVIAGLLVGHGGRPDRRLRVRVVAAVDVPAVHRGRHVPRPRPLRQARACSTPDLSRPAHIDALRESHRAAFDLPARSRSSPAATAGSARRSRAGSRDTAQRSSSRVGMPPRRRHFAAALRASGSDAAGIAHGRAFASRRSAPRSTPSSRTGPSRHPRQLRRHPARGGAARRDRGGLRRSHRRQSQGGDVPRRRRLPAHQVAAGRGGRHVHLLSVRAHFGLRDRGYSAYCSTKGGLVMLIRQHAMELARHGITVNGVAPTVVRTAMASHWLDNPVTHKQIVERIPLGRVAEPDDVVGPALLFCAPAGGLRDGADPLRRRRDHGEPVAGRRPATPVTYRIRALQAAR